MEPDKDDILKSFGEVLIREIRDSTLVRYEKIKQGKLSSVAAKNLNSKLRLLDKESAAAVDALVLDVIDAALFRFLRLVEQEEISISYGQIDTLNSISDGISGEIFGDDGWIALYSKFSPSQR